MAGKNHFIPSTRPHNKLMHERKMLANAYLEIANGHEGNPEDVPEWLQDPDFELIWHSATAVAMKRLQPEVWYLHHEEGKAWVPPTVPILTELGVLEANSTNGPAMIARIEAYARVLDKKNQKDPGYLTTAESDSEDDPEDSCPRTREDNKDEHQDCSSILEGIPTISADYDSDEEGANRTEDTGSSGSITLDNVGMPACLMARASRVDQEYERVMAQKRAFDMGVVDIPDE
jgi:hypothetical protein